MVTHHLPSQSNCSPNSNSVRLSECKRGQLGEPLGEATNPVRLSERG